MTGKTAIVTGAARGIGLATTHLVLEEGRRVAMIDRDADALFAAAEDLENVLPVVCDVSIPNEVDAMLDQVNGGLGRVDALINNAGVADFGPIGETDFEQWRTVMATNLDGVFLGTKHAIRAMKACCKGGGPSGSIVNLS